MFHVFHALNPLWNIYVEHKFPYSSAGYQPGTGTMFQCSSNFSFNLSVDRRPLLYVVIILLTKKYWNIWNIPHLTYNHAPFACSTRPILRGTLWNTWNIRFQTETTGFWSSFSVPLALLNSSLLLKSKLRWFLISISF